MPEKVCKNHKRWYFLPKSQHNQSGLIPGDMIRLKPKTVRQDNVWCLPAPVSFTRSTLLSGDHKPRGVPSLQSHNPQTERTVKHNNTYFWFVQRALVTHGSPYLSTDQKAPPPVLYPQNASRAQSQTKKTCVHTCRTGKLLTRSTMSFLTSLFKRQDAN